MWRKAEENIYNKHFINCTFEDPQEVHTNIIGAAPDALVDGALPTTYRTVTLTKATAGAYTLGAPTVDNQMVTIISDTAAAHVVTAAEDTIVDGDGTPGETMTFAAQIGANITLVSRSDRWVAISKNAVTISDEA